MQRIPGEAFTPAAGEAAADGAPLVGVLALQGDVLEHVSMLRKAGAEAVVVKRPEDLDAVDGLVIPGGESTTIGKLAEMYGLLDPLRKSIDEGLPVLGTCAGAILLSRKTLFADGTPADQPLVAVLDAVTRRNAFGRQVASFEHDLEVAGIDGGPVHAVFIRAPWFEEVGSAVTVLAAVGTPDGKRTVVVRQGAVMAAAFHPELSGDARLHAAFVKMVNEVRGGQ
ncbi:MAG: pyridoxal 5'-phosphate synthase glutaminase subunit PdxT [Nitriliruptorales bacterium]|nr:pyridoxal 5'-phosphate synthase glutaminase subunit PdxT [Nitriliruptorales bacterium]